MSEIVCGEPVALSAKLNEAISAPFEVGSKIIAIEQLAPGAKVLPHVLVWRKDPEFRPIMLIPEMARGAVPGFCTAIV